jgi:hypothetical protein
VDAAQITWQGVIDTLAFLPFASNRVVLAEHTGALVIHGNWVNSEGWFDKQKSDDLKSANKGK